MGELDVIAKYFPALMSLVAVIALIAYTKKALFSGVVSKEMFDEQKTQFAAQLEREKDFVSATKEAAAHLEEISRQLENVARKFSEKIQENTDRLRTLELVFSDNIDAIRELSSNCEKHRKGIPDTEVYIQQRKDKKP